jgi:hypothetical protein
VAAQGLEILQGVSVVHAILQGTLQEKQMVEEGQDQSNLQQKMTVGKMILIISRPCLLAGDNNPDVDKFLFLLPSLSVICSHLCKYYLAMFHDDDVK